MVNWNVQKVLLLGTVLIIAIMTTIGFVMDVSRQEIMYGIIGAEAGMIIAILAGQAMGLYPELS